MSNITEQAEWSPVVYLIDVNTPVRGGSPDFDINNNPTAGYSNAQAKQLADRTLYLKETIENTDIDVSALDNRVDTVETNLTAHIGSRGSAHTNVTTTEAGFMSAADKTKLNGIAAGAQVNVATNLSSSYASTAVNIASSTGTTTSINSATTSLAGVLSASDKTKLDGIAAGAQVNTVTSVAGKTGVVTLVKADVGLGNVDNTADTAKPVSTAQQTALNLKADLASPALTGTPTAPTATVGTNTTQIATTAFVLANVSSSSTKLFQVQDQKATNTNGGNPVATTWTNRTLNTSVTNQISGASLASDIITLPAGSYYIDGIVPFLQVTGFKARLYNTTDSTTAIVGASAGGTSNASMYSAIRGILTLPSSKNFVVQYYASNTVSGGLGSASNATPEVEIYTSLSIWKL